MNEILSNPFIKNLRVDQIPEEAWTKITGNDSGGDLQKMYQAVPWLFRGVGIRAGTLASIPFEIRRGETVVDESTDYQNALGFLKSLKTTLWLIEAGLALFGQHYLFKERNRARVLNARFVLASSITPILDKRNGLQGFKRTIGSEVIPLEVDDLVYFWPVDPFVEIGPPDTSPALAAMAAAGVLFNLDEFIAHFFARGAIKATVLQVSNLRKAEQERVKSAWERMFRGVANAWRSVVFNADSVTPVTVGEGVAELANADLTEEKREDIATALGVPHSLLFSNAANFATAQQDEMNFYKTTVLPQAEFIAEVLNEQLLGPAGYSLVFKPETLDLFQTDEQQRSSAYVNYINAGLPHDLVAEMLGLELPTGWEYAQLAEFNMTPEPVVAQGEPVSLAPGTVDNEAAAVGEARHIDLDKWERKALNKLSKGGKAAVPFESRYIPDLEYAAIAGALEAAETAEDVRAAFVYNREY